MTVPEGGCLAKLHTNTCTLAYCSRERCLNGGRHILCYTLQCVLEEYDKVSVPTLLSGHIGTAGQVGRVTAPGREIIADKASQA